MSASALRTKQATIQVSFNNVDVHADTIVGLDSATYGPPTVGIPVSTLVATDSIFWIQRDSNNLEQLCTTKTFGNRMQLNFLRGGVIPFSKTADPFIVAYHDESGLSVYLPSPVL